MADLNNYYANSPVQGLISGLLQGSQLGLQMRQVKSQEEQQKRENEWKNLHSIVEIMKSTKSPQSKKQFLPALNKAMKDVGLEGVNLVELDSPGAKNFLQTIKDGLDLHKKGLATEDQIMDLYINAATSPEFEDDPSKPKDISAGLQTMVKSPMAASIGSDITYLNQFSGQPEYSTPEAKQGIEGYQQGLLSKVHDLDPNQAKWIIDDLAKQKESEKPKDVKEGVFHPSPYAMPDGTPLLRNSRTGNYTNGKDNYNVLPAEAYRAEGLKTKDEDSLTGSVKSLNVFRDLEDTMKTVSTGIPKIGEAKVSIKRYLSKEDEIKWATARDTLKNLAQEIIKGIPSNFDVENFIKTLPSADYTYAENKQRIKKTKELINLSLRAKIQKLKAARYPIPEEITSAMKLYGESGDSDKIKPAESGQKKVGRFIIEVE